MTDVGTVTMSGKELNRLEVLGRVIERRRTQRQAAEQLGLSERQVPAAVPGGEPARRGRAGFAQARATQQPQASRGGS